MSTTNRAERVAMIHLTIHGTEHKLTMEEAASLRQQLSLAVLDNMNGFIRKDSHRIKQAVADEFGITVADMESDSRKERIVVPRQIAMCLHRQMTEMSLEEIGLAFQKPGGGGRDHGTVLHACKAMEAMMTQPRLKRAIERIGAALKQPSGKESE